MDNSGLITIVIAALSSSAVTGVFGKLISVYERKRTDDRQDRNWQRDRDDRKAHATTVSDALLKQADRVAHSSLLQTGAVLDKLAEASVELAKNTEMTAAGATAATHAYVAANDMNTKFLKIYARLDRQDARIDALALRP